MEKVTQSIYEVLEKEIRGSELSPDEKTQRLSRLVKIRDIPVNILLVGATGCGKSSTINALFQMEKAKVGVGVEPETQTVQKYELENLTLWDSPGFGDGTESDKKYMKMVQQTLMKLDKSGEPLVDLVLVIVDAGQKDLGTVYDCINDVLIPALGKDAEQRILIALNQCDMAMKGTHWDHVLNEPDSKLQNFLDKKAASVSRRIHESTGICFRSVYYSAGFKEEGGEQQRPYNLTKLLSLIVAAIPKEKRLTIADVLNPDESMWQCNDGKDDYGEKVKGKFWETVYYYMQTCSDKGADIGDIVFGTPGTWIGKAIGAVAGVFVGAFKAVFKQ